ncbi:MAG: glycosyltransferase family 39 protein [Candidatus Eisenbacteria bacterium]
MARLEPAPSPARQSLLLLGALALGYVLLHVAFLTRYGIFRDELYYVACSRHLAWGFVDQPPFSIAVLAAVRALFGPSLEAMRLVSALCGAGMVVLTGWLARDLGAGRLGQAIAALGAMAAPVMLYATHVYSMNAFEFVLWPAASLLLVRALRDGGDGRWAAFGLVVGIGLLNKVSISWFVAGALLGVLLTPTRGVLRTRGPWIATAIAGLVFMQHVWWQVVHGWPTLEFMRNATASKMTASALPDFVVGQVMSMNLFLDPLWIGGLLVLLFAPWARRQRVLGIVYLATFALLAVAGRSRASYLAPAYPALFAAGAAAIDRFLKARSLRVRWGLGTAAVVVSLVGGRLVMPLGIPVYSPERLVIMMERIGMTPRPEERHVPPPIPQHFADMFGWEDLAVRVARIHRALPPEDRQACAIYGQNYGEAGAIDYFGPGLGLPPAVSGHNNYWLWGPGPAAPRVVIVIGGNTGNLRDLFDWVVVADSTDQTWCMPYENHLPIHVCRGLRQPLAAIWPGLKEFI